MNKEDASAIAYVLYRDLHSGADEDFISSLLTSALNESEGFRKWFVHEIGGLHGNLQTSNFYAEANLTLPSCFRKKPGDYSRPDIVLLDGREAQKWELLEGRKCNVPRDLAGELHAIFVEMKWGGPSLKDSEKYIKFQDLIEDYSSENFVFITSLYKKAVERIRDSRYCDLFKYDKPMKDLLEHGIKVVTFKEILDALEKYFPSNTGKYVGALAREYFKLNVEVESQGYWKYFCEYYEPRVENCWVLRKELVEAVIAIGERTGWVQSYPRQLGSVISIKFLDFGKEPEPERNMEIAENNGSLSIETTKGTVSIDILKDTYQKISENLAEIAKILGSSSSG